MTQQTLADCALCRGLHTVSVDVFFIVISVISRSAEFGLADEVKNIWTAEIVAYTLNRKRAAANL